VGSAGLAAPANDGAHWLRTTALLNQNSSVSLPEGLLAESRADLLILRRG